MDRKARITTFYPVVSGDGAKFVTTNIAHYFKSAFGTKKVALVDFNLKNPYLAHALTTNDEVHGIDNLIDKIDGNLLDERLFLENMITMKDGVDLLKGTKLIGKYKVFSKEHFSAIVQHLRDSYDYVFVAVSSTPDNAGTVLGLYEADTVVMVGRNNVENARTMQSALSVVNQYKKSTEPTKFIYNFNAPSANPQISAFVKDNNLEVIGVLEYDENATDNLDLVSSGLKMFRSKGKNHDVFSNVVKSL